MILTEQSTQPNNHTSNDDDNRNTPHNTDNNHCSTNNNSNNNSKNIDNINTQNLEEKLINSNNIYQGSFLNVFSDIVQLPNGNNASREYIKHPGATAIIALTANQQIILEYQYRYPINKVMLEIPAGKLEVGESPLNCAKRELIEETGYTSDTWIKLGECFPCISYSNENIIYYLALNAIAGTPNLDDGEFIETITMPFKNFMECIYNGKINDSKTLAGALLYQGFLIKNKQQ